MPQSNNSVKVMSIKSLNTENTSQQEVRILNSIIKNTLGGNAIKETERKERKKERIYVSKVINRC